MEMLTGPKIIPSQTANQPKLQKCYIIRCFTYKLKTDYRFIFLLWVPPAAVSG